MLSGVKKWVQSVFLTKFQDAILSKLPDNGSKTVKGIVIIVFALGLHYFAGLDLLSAASVAGVPAGALTQLAAELVAIWGSMQAGVGAYHKVIKTINK